MISSKNNQYKGIRIKRIISSSPAYTAGLRKSDIILTVNGEPVEDDLDFSFFSACEKLEIKSLCKNKLKSIRIIRQSEEFLGIEFAPAPIRRCRNRCIFCFIDQLPHGMRKSLYIKDEDYRYSFLNGNYITLSSVTAKEMDKIIRLRLSPLYISVHATAPAIRRTMLNNTRAGRIISQLRKLEDNGITFHAQIVVCPGINDSPALDKTIYDLLSFKNGLLSIAVVPVGLTKHRKTYLESISKENALNICRKVAKWSNEDKKKIGSHRLFIADEFLIKAGLDVPESHYYEDYPQIENGVGLLRQLLDEWKMIKRKLRKRRGQIATESNYYKQRKKCYLILTSVSADSYIKEIIKELVQFISNLDITVMPVTNRFFGESVTVAGLITAYDIIRTVKKIKQPWDAVFIPRVILNYRNYTLDGYAVNRISKNIGVKVEIVDNLSQWVDFLLKNENAK